MLCTTNIIKHFTTIKLKLQCTKGCLRRSHKIFKLKKKAQKGELLTQYLPKWQWCPGDIFNFQFCNQILKTESYKHWSFALLCQSLFYTPQSSIRFWGLWWLQYLGTGHEGNSNIETDRKRNFSQDNQTQELDKPNDQMNSTQRIWRLKYLMRSFIWDVHVWPECNFINHISFSTVQFTSLGLSTYRNWSQL